MPLARTQIRHFSGLGIVHGLEDFQLLALAHEDPRVAALIFLQPHAVVLAAHGGAIACQTERITVVARQAGHAAVGLKLNDTALSVAVDDRPFATQVGGIKRTLKAASGRCASRSGLLGQAEMLFGT